MARDNDDTGCLLLLFGLALLIFALDDSCENEKK